MKDASKGFVATTAFPIQTLSVGTHDGLVIDLANSTDVVFVITINQGGTGISVIVEDSDDGFIFLPVDQRYLNGTEAAADLVDNGSSSRIGYKGPKRYIRLVVNNTFNNAKVSAVAQLAGVRNLPRSNQVKDIQPQPIPPVPPVPPLPPGLDTGLVLRFDAFSSNNVVLEPGDQVSQWNDTSPIGTNHAVQAVGSAQPIYVTSGVGGQPGLQTNGSSHFMTFPDGAFPHSGVDYELMAVMSGVASPGVDVILSTGPQVANQQTRLQTATPASARCEYTFVSGLQAASTYTPGQNFISNTSFDGTNFDLWFNNVLQNFATVPSNLGPTNNLLFNSTLGNEWYQGEVKEILVWNRKLSAPERTAMAGYVTSKWNFSI